MLIGPVAAGRATVTNGPDGSPGIGLGPPIGRFVIVPIGSSLVGMPGRSEKCGVPDDACANIAGAVGPALGMFDVVTRTGSGLTGIGGAVRCGTSLRSLIDCGRISGITTINVASIS
jgi:hypothetical protein